MQQPLYAEPVAPGRELAYDAPAQSVRDSIPRFLRQMTVSQWMILLYPILLYAVARKRETDDVEGIDASAMAQIAITGIGGVWCAQRLSVAWPAFRSILFKPPLLWIFLYAVLAASSTAWSERPSLTLYRGGQMVVYLLLVVDVLISFDNEQQLLKFQLCFAFVVGVFWQFTPLMYDLSLEAMHTSNVPGSMVGIAIAGCLARGKQWRILWWGVVATLIAATSSGSYLAMILAISVGVMALPARHAALGLCALALIALVAVTHADEAMNILFYGKATNQILNGTGRVPTWDWLLHERFPDHPYFGFGFGWGEVQARLFNDEIGGLKMMHMHSAIMSALMNLGAVGGVLLLLFWGGVLRAAWKIRTYPARPVMIAAVVGTILNSLVMESITAPMGYAWLGHMLIYATASRMGDADERSRNTLPRAPAR